MNQEKHEEPGETQAKSAWVLLGDSGMMLPVAMRPPPGSTPRQPQDPRGKAAHEWRGEGD